MPLYRFWSDTLRGHFYTADPVEKAKVMGTGPDVWHYEQIAYYVYPANSTLKDTVAVTRFWSPVFHHHFYTASPAERDHVVSTWPDAWSLEGPRFKVPATS